MKGIPGQQGPPGPRSGGITYVRWGRTTCPNTTGTELVYTGRAAGSHYSHRGGGSNYQCIVEDPENFDFGAGTVEASYMYGAEYEMYGYPHQAFDYINMMSHAQFAMLLKGKLF